MVVEFLVISLKLARFFLKYLELDFCSKINSSLFLLTFTDFHDLDILLETKLFQKMFQGCEVSCYKFEIGQIVFEVTGFCYKIPI